MPRRRQGGPLQARWRLTAHRLHEKIDRSGRQERLILSRVESRPVIRNIVTGISTDPLREARLYEYEHAVGLLVAAHD